MTKANLTQRKPAYLTSALAALAGLLVFWACHLSDATGEARFDVTPDSSWSQCDRLLVELRDTADKVVDTLFNDELKSLDQLKGLDASNYKGGRAVIYVLGKNKDGSICAEQSRSFDDKGGPVIVDTVSEPGVNPKSITLDPSSLSLKEGDSAVTVKASINPKFADQLFEWSVDDSSIAVLDLPKGPNASEALVIPLKKGTARIKVRAKRDTSKSAELVVEVLSNAVAPKSVTLEPSSLSLKEGDSSVTVKATIDPKLADQLIEWSVDDPSVATLDLPKGPNAPEASVIPLKKGTAHVRARAKRDTSISAELLVQVGSTGGKTISLVPDSLALFLGGPDSVLKASTAPEAKAGEIEWSSSDQSIVKVDDQGRVKAVKAGSAEIEAKFFEAKAKARIRVKRDAPVLTVAAKSGAAVNAPIVFSPKATQEFGSIVMYKFDLDGDGAWDDSLSGPFLGTSVELPPQTAAFAKEGTFKLLFLVRDSEGNEDTAGISVDIGNQPPEAISKSNDTLVTIKDFVSLEAKVHDIEGKVVLVGWDYDGDGKLDDSVKANDSVASVKGGHRYPAPGKFSAVLYATDDAGKTGTDSVRIEVVLDPPVADIGPDISVIAGSPVAFSVKGTDKFGAIAKREIKIGSGSFLNLSKQDTTIVVPGDSGKVIVVGRVTDDDGNSDEDSMVVTLLPPSKSNNDLSSLVASAGVLAPVFKPVTIAYSLAVGYADSLVSVTALTTDPAATLLINGKTEVSGKASEPVSVPVGTTQKAFEVVVTAQDGNQKSYNISVTRAPSADASLSKLEPAGFTLKPSFKPEILDYADTVAFKVASVTVKPTSAHPAAKLTVNDSAVVSGSASKSLPLDVGDNLIKISVTAQDGKTKSLYTVKVVRRAKVLVSRVVGSDSAKVDSLEAPLGAVVSLKAPDSVGYHFTKWALTEGSGTFQSDTVNPAKLTVKSGTVRATAAFAINEYTITGTIKGFAGGAFDHTTIKILHGKDTSITVTPLVGYRVLSVTDSGVALTPADTTTKFGAKKYKLTKVTKNHALEATFLKTYVLTDSAFGTGTISPSGSLEVDSGSTKAITMVSGSPSTGVWVSAFTDNGADAVASLTGDRMNTSVYTLTGINSDHTIKATFAVRTYRLIVTGHDLCINRVVSCPVGTICVIKLCLAGTGPDVDTIIAPHGATYNITTDTASCGWAFGQWNKDGVLYSTNRATTTAAITSDVTYSATYPCGSRLCLCRIIIDPPIILDPLPTVPAASTLSSPQTIESGGGVVK